MVKTLPALIASLRHYIALYQGNIVPLPGTKRYVGRENPHSLFDSSPFTKSSETPINTGVPRGEELAQLFTTLHPLFTFGLRTELKRKLDLFGRGLKPLFYVPQISQIYTDFSG